MGTFLLIFGIAVVLCFVLIGISPLLFEKYREHPRTHKIQDTVDRFWPTRGQQEFLVVLLFIGLLVFWLFGPYD